ncbi:MAG: PAS domain-containing protein [Candidatus Omnitrophica bacterium]|nr:PAS domain-containing protein [Candidatus Omnitrophota bacterium]
MTHISDFKVFCRSLLESLPYGVMILNQQGLILHMNRNMSFMLNITEPEAENVSFRDVLPREISRTVQQMVDDTTSYGFVMDRRISVNVAEKAEVLMAMSGSILRDEEGQPAGITLICREMTATRELDRMRELDKLKDDFISSVSHDLKNPLSSILGFSDILLEMAKEKDLSEETEYLQIIRQESRRLSGMIGQMLSLARIESGMLHLKVGKVVLKEVVSEVLKVLSVQSKGKHDFRAEMDDEIPELWLDREEISRVIMNLVSNAMKYSPEGGPVTVRGFVRGENVHLEVHDKGIGMSEETLSHMFEKFFRETGGEAQRVPGTGLGLVITKGIVEAHGGTISVESAVGDGSVFSVILPLWLRDKKPSA